MRIPCVCGLAVAALGLAVCVDRPAAAEDELRDGEVQRLIWEAVDTPEAQAGAALDEVTSFPRVSWQEVFDILAEPRPIERLTPPQPVRTDLDEHLAELAAFPWEPGVVRAYDIADDQRSWYSVSFPRDHDDEEEASVLLELGAFAPQAEAPSGWIIVRYHDHLFHAPDLGGAPFSLTAGTTSQSVLLTVLRDLERRVRFDPERVFVSGFSRGGNAALYYATHWPDLFAGALPASGYYPIEDAFLDNLDHVAVFAAWGDDAGHRAANAYQKRLVPRLRESGADVTGRPQEGRATDGTFGDDFMAWTVDRRRTSLPKSFRYTLRDPRHRGAYWAEVLEVEKTGGLSPVAIGAVGGGVAEQFDVHKRTSTLSIEVIGDNEVRVGARNVKRARLWLSPDLFDLAKPITIRHGRRTIVHEPTPSLETLIEAFRRTHDRTRLFPAFVDLNL